MGMRHLSSRVPRGARAGQTALGLIWLADGILQFQPCMFGKSFVTGVILPSASGQPGIVASPITWIAALIEPRVALFNAVAATLQVLIGLGLLYRPTVRTALVVSFAWALGYWVIGQGLGGIFTGEATDVSTAPLMIVIAAMLLARHQPALAHARSGVRGDARDAGGEALRPAADLA